MLGCAASRAISSAGRAPPRQGGGHWFEPSIAHLRKPRCGAVFGVLEPLRGSNQVANAGEPSLGGVRARARLPRRPLPDEVPPLLDHFHRSAPGAQAARAARRALDRRRATRARDCRRGHRALPTRQAWAHHGCGRVPGRPSAAARAREHRRAAREALAMAAMEQENTGFAGKFRLLHRGVAVSPVSIASRASGLRAVLRPGQRGWHPGIYARIGQASSSRHR